MKDNTLRVVAHVPVDVGTYLLNEKRELLVGLEARHKIAVMLIPSPALETPNYDVQRIRKDESATAQSTPSYHMAKAPAETELPTATSTEAVSAEVPAVKSVKPTAPAPAPAPSSAPTPARNKKTAKASKPGLFKRLFASLFGSAEKAPKQPVPGKTKQQRSSQQDRRRGGSQSRQQPQGNRRRTQPQGNRPSSGQNTSQRQSTGTRKPARPVQKQEIEKQAAPATAPSTTSAEKPAPSGDSANQQQRRGSRRGRRGGRRRSSSQNRNASTEKASAIENTTAGGATTESTSQPRPTAGRSQTRDSSKAKPPQDSQKKASVPPQPTVNTATDSGPKAPAAQSKPDGNKAAPKAPASPSTSDGNKASSAADTAPKPAKIASE